MSSKMSSRSTDENWDDEGSEDELFNEGRQVQHELSTDRSLVTGMILALISAFLLAAQAILVGYQSDVINPIQALFIRNCCLFVFVPFISWDRDNIYETKDLLANFFFGVFDNLGTAAGYLAIGYLTAADAAAIIFNKPIPAAILAWLFLGESFDLFDIVLAVLNGAGLVVISETEATSTDGTAGSSPALGVVLALISLLWQVSMYNTARWLSLREREDPCLLAFVSGFVGSFLSIIYLTYTNSWGLSLTYRDITISALFGITVILEMMVFLMSIKRTNVLIVAAIRTISIPVTYVFAITVQGLVVSLITLLGVGVTVATSFMICLKSYFLTS